MYILYISCFVVCSYVLYVILCKYNWQCTCGALYKHLGLVRWFYNMISVWLLENVQRYNICKECLDKLCGYIVCTCVDVNVWSLKSCWLTIKNVNLIDKKTWNKLNSSMNLHRAPKKKQNNMKFYKYTNRIIYIHTYINIRNKACMT